MPLIGLGTFTSRGLEVQHAVKWALEAGIKLIDTASIYKVIKQTFQLVFERIPAERLGLGAGSTSMITQACPFIS